MKRFGIPFLLCLTYVSLLVFVFSTDFSKKNSFFFENPATAPEIVANNAPAPTLNDSMAALESAEREDDPTLVSVLVNASRTRSDVVHATGQAEGATVTDH